MPLGLSGQRLVVARVLEAVDLQVARPDLTNYVGDGYCTWYLVPVEAIVTPNLTPWHIMRATAAQWAAWPGMDDFKFGLFQGARKVWVRSRLRNVTAVELYTDKSYTTAEAAKAMPFEYKAGARYLLREPKER